jgi:hypothetical protein
MSVQTTVDHLALGRQYGFPECCIAAWIADPVEAAWTRGAIWRGPSDAYVPCNDCMGGVGWFPYYSDRLWTGCTVLYRGEERKIIDDAYGVYLLEGIPEVIRGNELKFVWTNYSKLFETWKSTKRFWIQ